MPPIIPCLLDKETKMSFCSLGELSLYSWTNNPIITIVIRSGKNGPPECHSGLRYCIAVLAVPLEILGLSPGSVAAGRDRETHGAAHNWLSVVQISGGFGPAGMSLSHHALATPVADRAQCTLTPSPGVTVFPPTHWCGWLPG